MSVGSSPKLLYIATDIGSFLSHRLPLARAAQAQGYDVALTAPPAAGPKQSDYQARLRAEGIPFYPLALHRGSLNPLKELKSLYAVYKTLRRLRPDLVHLITAKPVFYGGIAARWLNIPSLAAITGMGFIFTHDTAKAKLLRPLAVMFYRLALNRPGAHALFQNTTDRALLDQSGVLKRGTHSLIQGGSGVDLNQITPAPLPEGPPIFALPARMLRDKGVYEFIDAARAFKAKNHPARFWLLGDVDPNNPTSMQPADLNRLQAEGHVEWKGYAADMNAALAQVHVVVLPSYREGFPKTLIDAAAAGRASLASDVAGCRDAVVEGQTGFLFPARDAKGLVAAMEKILDPPEQIAKMGYAARHHAEQAFDITRIAADHLALYAQLTHAR